MDSQLLNDFKPLGSRFKTCFTAGILDNAEVAGSGVCSDKLNADQRFFCQPFYDLPMYETASAVHVNLRRGLLHEYQLYDH
ncbi:unnamed protein product [Protopolystoma xenopodis]|uniref:Uncharacterized protein n=1 Tax=Protopolystoma xenopodis TaxID=117903 RepID=A0A448WVN9_9PLAT|nr:unnamed protein product [Protopolystoma xenopodis]